MIKKLLLFIIFGILLTSSAFAIEEKIDWNGGSSNGRTVGNGASQTSIYGTFETNEDYDPSRIDVCLISVGSPTGNIGLSIYDVASNTPSTLIETSPDTIDASTVPASYPTYNCYEYTFSSTSLTIG